MKNRRDFLRISGLAGAATLLPFAKLLATPEESNVCTLMPSETEGPFPYPGGELTNPLNQIDVRQGQTGIQIDYIFTVVDAATCTPLQNVRVDIWHCSKEGDYSGYAGFANQFFLRGYQTTDINGQVMFTSIYPGWYPGRATHVHFELFYNGSMIKTSQFCFEESVSNTVHVSPLYAANGINTTTNLGDGIFNNSPADLATETVAVTGDVVNGFTGQLTIGVSGVPLSINENNSKDNLKIFPNPVSDKVTLSHQVSDGYTTIKIFNLEGRIVRDLVLVSGSTLTNMDLQDLAKGIYAVVFAKGKTKSVVKFVKM